MKKLILPLVLLGCGLILWALKPYWQTVITGMENVKKVKEVGKVYFEFSKLPKSVVAQVGEQTLSKVELEHSAAMRTFKNKKRDILFLLVYNQYVAFSEKSFKKLEFSFKNTSRAPSSLLNEFGIPIKHETQVEFSAFPRSKGIARIDGTYISEKQIDKNNFLWGAFETEIFRFKLASIDKKIKRKVVEAEAKKLDISPDTYKEKYIFSKLPIKVTQTDINSYLNRYNIEDSQRARMAASHRILEARHQRGEDYILEKFVMDLPVKVNLQGPNFKLETKDEWTPFIKKGDHPLELNLISGTRSTQSIKLLEGLLPLIEKYDDIQLTYRPVFSPNDDSQSLTSMMHFCVWMEEKDHFWDYLKESLGDFTEKTEESLFFALKKVHIPEEKMKKCLAEKKYKEVVDYHVQSANYQGIFTGPVLYVGGEVLYGNIIVEDIKKIIDRKLQLPVAGVW